MFSSTILSSVRRPKRPSDKAPGKESSSYVNASSPKYSRQYATEASTLAGEYFALYLRRGGRAKRVPPDFLIGAHAAMSADRLLARDRGYVGDYFTSLELWDPSHR